MKILYYKLIWKLHRLLAPGCLLIIKPTLRCNYSCEYCSNVIATGARNKFDESTVEDWVAYVKRFPVKIQVIAISGGEPMMYPEINKLINRLIGEGFWIRMLTNLNLNVLNVKPSTRFCIQPSYHATQTTIERFKERLKRYSMYHIVITKRFTETDLKHSKKFELIDEQYSDIKNSRHKNHWFRNRHSKFVVTPDLTLYTSCLESNIGKVMKESDQC